MSIGAIRNLRDVRERLLGFTFDGVVRATGITRDRLVELENDNSSITVWEGEVLGDLYGVDGDALAEDVPHVPPEDVVSVLANAEEFRTIGDSARARVIRTANAARELVRLRELLHEEPPQPQIVHVDYHGVPHRMGANAARLVREKFQLKDHAVLSLRDFFREQVDADLLYARLGPDGPAGLTFASPAFGPVVVLNLDGKNTNPCYRRFSLAHELYHLLVDYGHREPLAILSGWLEEGERLEREQRANSFAIRFLCPESKLPYNETAEEAASALVAKWGMHYQAARLYLKNERNMFLPGEPPPGLKVIGTESFWADHEKPDGLDGFPLDTCPPERRTRLAYLGSLAYSRGLSSRDAFARTLGVSPLENVESVLDHFSIDPPTDRGIEAA